MMISVSTDSSIAKEIEQEVNEDIKAFETWFEDKFQDGGLSPMEKAIIKTYLYFKTVASKE